MFDYSMLHWTTFVTAAILLNLSTGPDIAFILGQTVRGGRRAGFAAMAGIWTGALVHVGFAAAGLTAILASSAVAFSIVKRVGAAYLIYLGLSAQSSKGGKFINDKVEISPSGLKVMRQGVLVSFLNPKIAIFFLAFLPQFVVPGMCQTWAQLALHGTLIIGVAALVEPPLVLLGARLTNSLHGNPSVGIWMDRVLGGLFITLGIKLALQER
ncbi:MAG: LysE family translocator [Paracoccaceae bacterium]|nr:LysE family translocator [Paracoccaceae bacterium]